MSTWTMTITTDDTDGEWSDKETVDALDKIEEAVTDAGFIFVSPNGYPTKIDE